MTSRVSAIEAIEKAMEGVTPGPWKAVSDANFDSGLVYTSVQPINIDEEAMKPLAMANGEYHVCRMSHTAAPWRFNYHRANARYIAACNPVAMRKVLALARQAEALQRENADKDAETSWHPITTCPIREPVDLWCVYGGEEFAEYDGGASIGKLVPNRHKTEEYGFFGNQSNDGVPQGHASDLIPVAWRQAVPQCPSELIAEVLGIPRTLEDARALLGGENAE